MIVLLTIIILMIARAFLSNAIEELHDAFNDPDWMKLEETYGKDSD